jgi:hypothetical protein
MTVALLFGWDAEAASGPVIQIDYSVATDGSTLTATATFLNDVSATNLHGVILVIDSPDLTGINNHGTYNGRPFWNLGSLTAGGSAVAELRMTIAAGVRGAPLNIGVRVFSSLSAPVVDAGRNVLDAAPAQPVRLDGSLSYDPDGNDITYRWAFHRVPSSSRFSDPALAPDGSSTFLASFIPDVPGEYEIKLDVSDGVNLSTDIVYVLVTDDSELPLPLPLPPPPTEAVTGTRPLTGDLLALSGEQYFSRSGKVTAYAWRLLVIPEASFVDKGSIVFNAETGECSFTPDKGGQYLLQLKMDYEKPLEPAKKSKKAQKHNQTVIVKVTVDERPPNQAPVAAVMERIIEVPVGIPTTLDGTASVDPEGAPLAYSWRMTGVPSGSTAALSGPATAVTTFVPDKEGFYRFDLTVSDGSLASLPCVVHVVAFNPKQPYPLPGTPQSLADELGMATTLPGEGVVGLISPMKGATYPLNVPLEIRWTRSSAITVVSVQISYANRSFSVITVADRYVLSPAVLSNIVACGGTAQVSLTAMVDGYRYETRPVPFTVTSVPLSGKIYFWGVTFTEGSLYQLSMGSSQPVPIYGSAVGKKCCGCHSRSSAGDMAFTDQNGSAGLRILNRTGSMTDVSTTWSAVLSWNRDGTKLLYAVPRLDGDVMDCNIYVYDVATGTSAPVPGLSRPDRDEIMAVWAPDGSIVAVVTQHLPWFAGLSGNNYFMRRGTISRIVHLRNDGSEVRLSDNVPSLTHYYPSVSPDGKWLVFNTSDWGSYASSDAKLWIMPMDGSTPARELVNANTTSVDDKSASVGYGNSWPQWSPDSSWIVFSSNRPLLQENGTFSRDWSLYIAAINGNGNDSIALPVPGASRPGLGEHVQNWFY